jgi:hypothetical protein
MACVSFTEIFKPPRRLKKVSFRLPKEVFGHCPVHLEKVIHDTRTFKTQIILKYETYLLAIRLFLLLETGYIY